MAFFYSSLLSVTLCLRRRHIVYVVFSYLGQLVSNKKEELTAILDHFNIQVLLTFTLHDEVFTLAIT